MRRSLAPSQLEQRRKSGNLLPTSVCNSNSCHKNSDANSDGSITIQRLPLFGFLSIPDRLHQQFVVNSGSTITEKYVVFLPPLELYKWHYLC